MMKSSKLFLVLLFSLTVVYSATTARATQPTNDIDSRIDRLEQLVQNLAKKLDEIGTNLTKIGACASIKSLF